LLALFPDQSPLDVLPYIYLGAQFFLEYRASMTLDCGTHPPSGTISVP
jgi:hypothetical protein